MLKDLGDGNFFSGPLDRIHVQEARFTEGTVNLGQSPQSRKEEEMKKMKKFFAMFLALAMVLGMSVTTLAEGTAKITISNVPEGATIKWEKIAEAEPTTPLGWKLVNGIELSNDITIEELAEVAGGNTNAESGTINSNAKVAEAIEKIALNKTLDTGSTEIAGVTPGLYVIEVKQTGYTFTRMLAYVAWNEENTAAVDVTNVQAKGAMDQVNKAITAVTDGEDHTSVTAGDVVPFTVTAKYPYLAQTIENPTFVITDTVAGGTIQGTPVVTIGGTTAGTDVTVVVSDDGSGFTATFAYNIANASKDVVITYDVVVAEGINPLENKVSSSISSLTGGDPNVTEALVISPKVEAVVEKVNEDGEPLEGAEFTLYVKTPQAEATYVLTSEGVIVPIAELGDATAQQYVSVVGEPATTTLDRGKATAKFVGLDAGKEYWVAETKAPSGYKLNNAAKKLEGAAVTAGTAVKETIDGKEVMVTRNTKVSDFTVAGGPVVNTTLSALPSTGGIGTTIFTVGGCAIMIIAAGLYFSLRRKTVK